MKELLDTLFAERGVLVADGAMGTSLFDLGLADGASSELWNIQFPERVLGVHRSFVNAGADIILTNTFGANRFRLHLQDLTGRVRELNMAGAEIARAAADQSGRHMLVAGSIGPTGDVMEPLGTRTVAEAEEAFHEQAEALKEGGVDFAWIETMYSLQELVAAVAGVDRAGLPYVATMNFDTGGCTMMGVRPDDAMRKVRSLECKPLAFGANCGVGPAQLIDSVLGLASAAGDGDRIVAKANCGLPEIGKDMKARYSGTPQMMAIYACMARAAGANIIGGCCGTKADHIQAMVAALAGTSRGPTPTYGEIEASLGPVRRTVHENNLPSGRSCS